jgi:outer membrane receptor protein involved in Fe transport
MFNTSRLLLCGVSATAVAFAAPAFAQTAPGTPAPNSSQPGQATPPNCPVNGPGSPNDNCVSGEVETESGTTAEAPPSASGTIVVTGTRIQRPNLSSPVPITSIGQEELVNQGQASVGDALNDLPALRSTFSQQNSGRFIGTAGQNFLDLRGLGTSRTLVLVNGRRHITASPGDFIVDVNTVPQDLIERVDIVTGGESAVYGSDAIAGVVNFVLKRDFEGFRVRGQAGISSRGDRPVDFISGTFGRNFADGRGNIAANVEYTHAGSLLFSDRPAIAKSCGFQPIEITTGEVNGTNGSPDQDFFCHIRLPGLTEGGSLGRLGNGSSISFDQNGNLVIGSPVEATFTQFGGRVLSTDPLNGITVLEGGQAAVGQDRWTANVLAHFDVSDAFKPFIEAKYVNQHVHQLGQPTFFQGRLSSFFGAQTPSLRCNNPFLTAQNLQVMQSFGICTNVATGTFTLNRFNTDFGNRNEEDFRKTYRIVGGVQGDFLGDWHYEVSANYGHFKSDNAELNDLLIADVNGNPAGFSLAVDAVRDANGNIVCRSTLTNPGNGCVPINLFGQGAPSQAALDFVNTRSDVYSKAAELDLLAFMSGNSGRWFELPGGPIGFSAGLEYRRETAEQHADPVSAAGGTFFNAFQVFDPPAFTVKEVFGEIEFPILRDHPWAHELTLSGAARYSDYNTAADTTFAYNINGVYAPTRDVRLRANYSRSVRVPTLSDLYSPASQNFAFLSDPCDQLRISNNPNFAANCAALGVPTTVLPGSPCTQGPFNQPVGSPFQNCIANNQTSEIVSSGNPNLEEEVGKSLTIGGVLTPRFLPGFSFSADYFDIKVENLIAVLGGNTILNLCFGSAGGVNNQFCQLLFPRDQFGLFQEPALLSGGVNFAKQTSKGVDFDMSYRKRFANGNRLSLRGIATWTTERNNFTDPVNPALADRQLGELGDPVFSGTLITGYGIGRFDLRYTFRYIGHQEIFAYESRHAFQDRPPTNPDVATITRYPVVTYSDVRLSYTIPNKAEFYVGVDNLFDKLPPLGLTGTGAGSAIFSNIGRFFYAGVVLDLDKLGLPGF